MIGIAINKDNHVLHSTGRGDWMPASSIHPKRVLEVNNLVCSYEVLLGLVGWAGGLDMLSLQLKVSFCCFNAWGEMFSDPCCSQSRETHQPSFVCCLQWCADWWCS